MWFVTIVISVWVGLMSSFGVTAVDDFKDTYQGYDIIYHHGYHLLLAIHGNECYFVSTPQSHDSTLQGNSLNILSDLHHTEQSLLSHIQRNSSGEVMASTLGAVREKYHDLLADFHCLNKRVFEVNFYKTDSGSSQVQAFTCEGKIPGMYADPTDCHYFILCGGWRAFREKCAPGTAFLPSSRQCEHIRYVPNCHD